MVGIQEKHMVFTTLWFQSSTLLWSLSRNPGGWESWGVIHFLFLRRVGGKLCQEYAKGMSELFKSKKSVDTKEPKWKWNEMDICTVYLCSIIYIGT